MRIVTTRAELAALDRSGTVSFVPTMGALHAGHAALMRRARGLGDTLVVSIFVNPTQFGPGEDYDAYPRTPEADLALCEREGVEVVFMPSVEEMYPLGLDDVVFVEPGALGGVLEGAQRPTHFRGVLTVVAKLFTAVRPDVAVFGEKDFQQLALIRRMVRELGLGVEIDGHPIVREDGGLALSSRNIYLSETERRQALALSAALRAGAAETSKEAVLKVAADVLTEAGVAPDYLVVTDPYLGEVDDSFTGEARLIVAARVGKPRLLDNIAVHLKGL